MLGSRNLGKEKTSKVIHPSPKFALRGPNRTQDISGQGTRLTEDGKLKTENEYPSQGENYQESESQTSTLLVICPRKFYF